jgi:hypothetical protein
MNFFKKYAKFLFVIFINIFTQMSVKAAIAFPTISVGMGSANSPQEFTQGVQILILLTVCESCSK